MNDSEIIKALECCYKDDCDSCPNNFGNCNANLAKEALDLINRQQAEIERLHSMNQAKLDMIYDVRAELETAKSEAVSEFAEKLKSMLSFGRYTSYEQIDNPVKEMGCNK